MEIKIARDAGFCFGVERAVEIVRKKAQKGEIYTLGPLIHNPPMIEKLEREGVFPLTREAEVKGKRVVIPSHGLPPKKFEEVLQEAEEVIDATCPFVKRAQDMAKRLEKEGYTVVIIGDSEHPEVKGIAGNLKNSPLIFSCVEEVPQVLPKRIGIVCQTTMNISRVKEIIASLLDKVEELKFVHTICNATAARQQALRDILKDVDGVIVIGGKNSGNTRRLYKISVEAGKRTWWIERSGELEGETFDNIKKMGITAGASTPEWVIQEVVEYLEGL
ncbi:MAG: 4-hydroxy-3-methylbut-2-enyl diphosphate reductase [Caldiserica bacterium]|nr:4-hydroxy-3-methylbut-2-enyl diphosphate reductase [Caldisericota bacterium]